jgi:hypothetical protein
LAHFACSNRADEYFHGGPLLATYSNEARIAHTLKQLGCAAQNFCRIAGVGLTRFLQGLNGEPGKHFGDDSAAHLLDVLGELYELQLDVDGLAKTHVPIDFARVDAVMTALAIRRVAKIEAEGGRHSLDALAELATNAVR